MVHRLAALGIIVIASSLASFTASAAAEAKGFDPNTVVFIGSSTIHKWHSLEKDFPGVKTLNLGKNGTDYPYLITNIPSWTTKYPSKRYVVYSGDNDIASGRKPEEVAHDFMATVELLRAQMPTRQVFVFSIKPCPDRKAKLAEISATNDLIRDFARGLKNVTFIDVFSEMVTPNGVPKEHLFIDDGLHMNANGYSIWTKALRPLLSPSAWAGLDVPPVFSEFTRPFAALFLRDPAAETNIGVVQPTPHERTTVNGCRARKTIQIQAVIAGACSSISSTQ